MIGVFDSGIGGLTVLKELLRMLPECGFVYLGDTARTPYGSKSPETVQRYAREDAEFLVRRGARMIVVACNTASALAARELTIAFPRIPIIEVVTPAIAEAVRVTRIGRIGVLGTRATIDSGVHERLILSYTGNYDREKGCSSRVVGQACPLLVPLVEEGWIDRPETRSIVHEYLAPIRTGNVDTLVLGCTHYPLLEPIIRAEVGDGVVIVNPARATAELVRRRLDRDSALAVACRGSARTIAMTDRTPHFDRIAREWLGIPVVFETVRVPS